MTGKTIKRQQDLTPYLGKASTVITGTRLVEFEDGEKEMQIKFSNSVPQARRNFIIVAIGKNILNVCEKESEKGGTPDNNEILAFMNGAKIKEWETAANE